MQDPISTNPELYSVVFENERVRVLRYHDKPGDSTKPHHHPDSVMVTLSSFQRRVANDGKEVDVAMPAGEVRWLDAQDHAGHNTGTTDTITVFVELKESAWGSERQAPTLGPRL